TGTLPAVAVHRRLRPGHRTEATGTGGRLRLRVVVHDQLRRGLRVRTRARRVARDGAVRQPGAGGGREHLSGAGNKKPRTCVGGLLRSGARERTRTSTVLPASTGN